MADPKPLADLMVNDRFWLSQAQEAVKGAIKGPEERAAQLVTAIGWFWTVYSSAGLLAIALAGDRLGVPMALLIVAPSFVLILAYWRASKVCRPHLFDFDPRVPAQIQRAHAEAALAKRRDLAAAESLVLISAVVVAVGLACGVWITPRAEGTSLTARFSPSSPLEVLVVAEVPAGSNVTFTAMPVGATTGALAPVNAMTRADRNGVAQVSLRLSASSAVRVTASWQEAKESFERGLAVDLKP